MNWRDIRCSKCKKWATLHQVWTNWNDELTEVTVKCKRCGIQKAEYPSYESIMGFGDKE